MDDISYVRKERLVGEFTRQPTGTACAVCGREMYKYWNKSPRYVAGGRWNIKCPGCEYRKKRNGDSEYHKKLYQRRKELHPTLVQDIAPWVRSWQLRRSYGIDEHTYQRMLDKQHGVCAICMKIETRKHRDGKILHLSIDHDHITGRIRGLLCSTCNLVLGLVESRSDMIFKMQEYIREYKEEDS